MKMTLTLLLITALAFTVRVYKFTQYPRALYWDEVSIGYNAYSILVSGADEYGVKFPLVFEAFQENKLPGYVYLTVISIAIFGLSELAIRFPAVIFATAAIPVIYLISTLSLKDRHKKTISLLAALFFAISPWSIQFSRAGFEANGGVFFSLLGIYCLLSHKKLLSSLFLALSCYFYYQFLIFSPLLFLYLLFFVDGNFKQKIKTNIVAIVLLSVFLAPLVISLLNSTQGRIRQIEGPFSDLLIQERFVAQRVKTNNSFTSRILHNRFTYGIPKIFSEYKKHFTYDFLFKYGDLNQRHRVEGTGALYKTYLIFLPAGLWALLENRKLLKLLIPWVILSPLASSLVYPNPHALRAIMLNPALLLLSSLGVSFLFQKAPLISNFLRLTFIGFLLLTTSYYFYFYLVSYFDYTLKYARVWAWGHKELFVYLKEVENKYDQIYITGKYWRPYIFFLFYNKFPPDLYQAHPTNNRVGKYYFGSASYDRTNPRYDYQEEGLTDLLNKPNTLFVLGPDENKPIFNVNKVIYSPSGEKVFLIADYKYL